MALACGLIGLPTVVALVLLGAGTAAVAAAGSVIAVLVATVVRARRELRPSPDATRWARALPPAWSTALFALAMGGLGLVAGLAAAGGLAPHVGGVPAGWGLAVGALLAPVFLILAAGEVVVMALLVRPTSDRSLLALLVAQAAILALTPTLFTSPTGSALAAYAGAALVVAMLVVSLQFLYRNKQLHASVLAVLIAWPLAAMVTAAGWFLWALDGWWVPLAVGVVVQIGVAAFTTFRRSPAPSGERIPWLLRPFSIFEFLLFTFLAEFFLGALLDYRIVGPGFLQYIPFVPPTGTGSQLAGLLVYNGLWFAAAILASAWFLILLGFTMGPLVVLKIRETHERAQKYRLGMTIAAFALAAIYLPSLASSTPLADIPWLANIPVIGWGFGLRDGGPFESGIFLAVIVMYALVGVLTVMFGRKAICSVMCGAALMYQGTAMSEMRGFNQTSRVGRHFLGSQLSTAYVAISGVALASLFAVSFLSVLRWIPTVQVASGQLDTATLPLPIELYFGAVWFAMFVTTPFIGTYNCATTGFCHWGALTLPFARVGFFRLKVKDKKVCQACTTFDCAKACPVGLVDMPLYFRRDGEYRSSKCCGVGDCVGACPYGNMYHQDVRFWIRRKLSGRAPAPQAPIDRGIPLPMVAAVAPNRAAPAAVPIASEPTTRPPPA